MLINIVTPAFRLGNLSKIQESVVRHRSHHFATTWWIIYDKGVKTSDVEKYLDMQDVGFSVELIEMSLYVKDYYGYHKRNHYLDISNNHVDLVYFLDDDNCIHPDLFKEPFETTVMGNQVNKNEDLRLSFNNPIEVGHVDLGQLIIKRTDIGHRRFNDSYTADGELYHKLYVENGLPIIRTNKVTSYYNKLK